MSDDESPGFDAIFLKWPPFSFTPPIDPSSTRNDETLPTLVTGTDFPSSTPPLMSSDISPPSTVTETADGTITDATPSHIGPPDTLTLTIDLTSFLFTLTDISSLTLLPTGFTTNTFTDLDSSITIDLTPASSPSPTLISVSDSLPFTPTLSTELFSTLGSSPTPSPTLELSTTPDFTFTSFHFTMTTPPPSTTSSDSTLTPSTSSPTTSSSSDSLELLSTIISTKSYPPPVTQTILTFNDGTATPAQTRTSSGHTGMMVAAITGAIAFVAILTLLAILWRKRHLKRARQRAALDPFHDLDGEMIAVNVPLIIGDAPASGGAVQSDPFTDDSRPIAQSRSLSPAAGQGSGGRSETSHQAVVGTAPTPEHGSGESAGYHNQRPPADQPPSQPSSEAGTTRSRSPHSLPPVQTQFIPQFPAPRPATSPLYDSGAIAYLRYADQAPDRGLPSPGHDSTGHTDDNRLTSAFSVASELSPQYTSGIPPPPVDETWRNSPDPIQAASSYCLPVGRRQSFTPSVSGQVGDDDVVISPLDTPTQGFTSPASDDMWSPYTIRGDNFGRPSPIPELTETQSHSQEGSNDTGTWISSQSRSTTASYPVVMTAERLQLTPALSMRSPSFSASLALSASSHYEDSSRGLTIESSQLLPQSDEPPPPIPPLPPVQPLTLGRKRS